MLKAFKQNVSWLQTIEHFVRMGDVAFCQITLTTSFLYRSYIYMSLSVC